MNWMFWTTFPYAINNATTKWSCFLTQKMVKGGLCHTDLQCLYTNIPQPEGKGTWQRLPQYSINHAMSLWVHLLHKMGKWDRYTCKDNSFSGTGKLESQLDFWRDKNDRIIKLRFNIGWESRWMLSNWDLRTNSLELF